MKPCHSVHHSSHQGPMGLSLCHLAFWPLESLLSPDYVSPWVVKDVSLLCLVPDAYTGMFLFRSKKYDDPLSLCVCLYQWRPKLTSSVVPHHFSTFVFWSKFSHRAQNTPILLLCWPASPEFSCLSLPSREITQVCWHTQLLRGCWRLRSGPYIYAYIMHFTNLAVFPRHPHCLF